MPTTIQFAQAQRSMSKVVDQVERGESVVITRRDSRFLLWKVEDAVEALSNCYKFSPEVFISDSGVSIWLPELELHGEGESIEEAQEDVLESVLEYLEDWPDELRNYPNHAARAGWVRRLGLAIDRDDLRSTLFEQ